MKIAHLACLILTVLAPVAASAQALPTSEQQIPAGCAPPDWPKSSIRLEKPVIVVEFLIDAAGRVQNGRVVETSGAADFDQAALAALRRCVYTPVRQQGTPVAGRIRVKYAWKVE